MQEFTGWRDLVGKRYTWLLFSGIVIILGIVSLVLPQRGLNVGIDFTGGYIIQYTTDKKVTAEDVRAITKELGIRHNPVQILHGDKGFLLRTSTYDEKKRKNLLIKFRLDLTEVKSPIVPMNYLGQEIADVKYDLGDKEDVARFQKNMETFLDKKFKGKISLAEDLAPEANPTTEEGQAQTYNLLVKLKGVKDDKAFKQAAYELYYKFGGEKPSAETAMEEVEPTFSHALFNRALIALIIATVGILIYVWIRFELWFAVAAIIALIHDCLITMGAFSVFQLEINVAFVAIILTVFGYSINDSIVIFDRIRENMRKHKKLALKDIINTSLWETMARSINTTLTTQFTILAIMIFGGISLRDFSIGIFVGILAGAYSSIFVAAPIAYIFKRMGQEEELPGKAQQQPAAKKKAERAKPQPAAAKEKADAAPGAGADKATSSGQTTDKKKKKGKQRRR